MKFWISAVVALGFLGAQDCRAQGLAPDAVRQEAFSLGNLPLLVDVGPVEAPEGDSELTDVAGFYLEEVRTLEYASAAAPEPAATAPLDTPSGSVSGVWEFLGKVFWHVIENCKTSAEAKDSYAAVVPEGVKDWRQLYGWKRTARVYRWGLKNRVGTKLTQATVLILHDHDGRLRGQNGRFVAAGAVALETRGRLGSRLSVSAEVPKESIMNVAGKDEPVVAAMNLHLKCSAKDFYGRPFNTTVAMRLRGDGGFEMYEAR